MSDPRKLAERFLDVSSSPSTPVPTSREDTYMPIHGQLHIGDRVSYEDMANPRKVGTVKAFEGTAVVVVTWDDGEKIWSDCRQHGWNRADTVGKDRGDRPDDGSDGETSPVRQRGTAVPSGAPVAPARTAKVLGGREPTNT